MKTSELTGVALDWAVAKCAGHLPDGYSFDPYVHCYSTSWAKGGPIIAREKIALRPTFTEGGYRTSKSSDAVHAKIELPNGAKVYDHEKSVWEYGPTPLVAAMRCYVASKLGDNIDIPEELQC